MCREKKHVLNKSLYIYIYIFVALSIQSAGPCTRKLDTYYQIFFSEIGIDKDIEFKLGRFLTKSGFTHVDQEEIAIPLGEWPASDGTHYYYSFLAFCFSLTFFSKKKTYFKG